jgi:tetratricopeptide (TPR) repeat protein
MARLDDTSRLLEQALDAHEAGHLAEAEAAYVRLMQTEKSNALVYNNFANLLRQTRRAEQAEIHYRRALELWPDSADILNNLGSVLEDLYRLTEAELAFRRALALKPDFAAAHCNLGALLEKLDRFTEAEAVYRHALALNPDLAAAQFNLGTLLLAQGRYADGWKHYEARREVYEEHGLLPFPRWNGERLEGKSLLLLPEQGYGDTIQFVRYASLLKGQGLAKLSLVCSHAMLPLLQTVAGVDALITEPGALRPHDYWSSPLSLPYGFGTTLETIPARIPYMGVLAACLEKWRARLPAEGVRVGIVWKGNPEHLNDANRSLTHFSDLSALWAVPGVQFISLQKGQGENEPNACVERQPAIALGHEIRDFGDTAGIVAQLDLVICVDTSIAHLSGALGIPCWVLLPKLGLDWRWLMQGDGSPWYPKSMRLFRQSASGGWPEVIQNVATALSDWVRTRSRDEA